VLPLRLILLSEYICFNGRMPAKSIARLAAGDIALSRLQSRHVGGQSGRKPARVSAPRKLEEFIAKQETVRQQ
jgi:hypothetical protein